MEIELNFIIKQLLNNSVLLTTTVLTIGVIFVNGWTDAPNAIATCVATRAMEIQPAIFMAAVFNFFGVFGMTLINSTVAMTVKNMVNFNGNTEEASLALCAALFAIIIWAVAAWYFGIPTSESHALIAGLSGAAVALHNGFGGINANEWIKVLYGLVLSTFLGLATGFIFSKIVVYVCKNMDRRKTSEFFRKAQVGGAAAMSFMHGAQDGQKFIGVLILGVYLANGSEAAWNIDIPFWMMLLCSAVMAIGTSIGGYRIIKAVGMDIAKLEVYQGFAADASGAFCLLISSIHGIPVSTTHTKTTAVMGVGAAKRLLSVNLSVVKNMVLTWVFTFPGCGLIGYLMVKVFSVIL